MFHLGRTLYSLLGLKWGIYFFATKDGSQCPSYPHVGHSESLTMCQCGKSYATHPLKEANGEGLKMSAYIYTLKNVARVLLVSYYLLVFHYVFFLSFVEVC